jgi:steroid delta-isomerase-like uncharacterized protein
MAAEDNKAILERARERWNAGDKPGYLALYDADAVLHVYPGVEPGLDGIRRFYEAFWTAFPDSRLTFEDVLAEADRVAVRFRLEGTHQGEFQGIPATGRPIVLAGMTILRFARGKCVERWSQADFAGLLSAITTPPQASG